MWPIIEQRDPDRLPRLRQYVREIWRYNESSSGAILLLPCEENLCNSQRLPYLLPLLCGTVTSTCSSDELPPLSVQVILIV